MKVKRANRLMSIIDEIWVIHLQKVDTLSMIGIQDKYMYFHFIPVIMVLYIYKYWFKMLERLKFPSLIKACASSTNCTMGNLICSRPMQHTYILQSMLNLMRFISFLLCKSLIQHRLFQVFGHCSQPKMIRNHGCIWSEVLRILLNDNQQVNECRKISRPCKTTLTLSCKNDVVNYIDFVDLFCPDIFYK